MKTHGWPERLHEYIEAQRDCVFEYGIWDCALFAAGAVQAMTGTDYAADLRGYKSQREAYEIIARYGSIEAMLSALLGAEPIHPAFAHRGDVVLGNFPIVEGEAGETIGICEGVHSIFPCPRGTVKHRTLQTRLAWRI